MALLNANSIIQDAAEQIITKLTPQLRNMANDAGWPVDIVETLSLAYVAGSIIIEYPQAVSTIVEDLEYGTEGSPPNSVLRPFTLRYESEAAKFIHELIGDDVYMNGGGW